MNKQDLVNVIREKGDLTKNDAQFALENVLESILTGIKEDKKVNLQGFGTFKLVERKERACKNPQTGEAMVAPAHNAITFKIAPMVRDAVK